MRHHIVRQRLQVVRRQVAVISHHTSLKHPPCIACNGFKIGLIVERKLSVFTIGACATHPPNPYRRRGPQQAHDGGQKQLLSVGYQQYREQEERNDRQAPMRPQ